MGNKPTFYQSVINACIEAGVPESFIEKIDVDVDTDYMLTNSGVRCVVDKNIVGYNVSYLVNLVSGDSVVERHCSDIFEHDGLLTKDVLGMWRENIAKDFSITTKNVLFISFAPLYGE